MSDIFREVEEDVRRERLEKLWKQYGDYVIAGVAVIVVGVAGYKLWQHYEAQQLAKASVAYSAAIELSNGDRNTEAAQVFAKIAKNARNLAIWRASAPPGRWLTAPRKAICKPCWRR